jgi:hypothetical protein
MMDITYLDPQSLLINIYKPKHDFGLLGLFMDRPYFIDEARHEIHPKRPNKFSLAYLNTHQKNQFFLLVGGLEHLDYFSIQLGMSSSQLTFTPAFFRGVGELNHQPAKFSPQFFITRKDPEFLGFLGIHQPESVFHIAYEPHMFFLFVPTQIRWIGIGMMVLENVSPSRMPGSAVPTVGLSETMVIPMDIVSIVSILVISHI